jgi:hypothetical protein
LEARGRCSGLAKLGVEEWGEGAIRERKRCDEKVVVKKGGKQVTCLILSMEKGKKGW